MVTTKRPELPTLQQRERFPEWEALLILWEQKTLTVPVLAEQFHVSRQAMHQKLTHALQARAKGWI